jgi:uncharacterized membrane protein YgdD (TMEM256/DUF423 family)
VTSRATLAVAGALLALAMLFGALGAHALAGSLAPDRLQVYRTAVEFHFYQALGLLGVGLALRALAGAVLRTAAAVILAGTVLFCGGLYALALGAPRALGVSAPLGGLALIGGWLLFAFGAWRAHA